VTKIPYLDGWRGCAILAVLFGHFVAAAPLNAGRFGVELFFVLSGRLMAEILFVQEKPLSQFYPRRLSRIYPALIIFVGAMFAAGVALDREPTAAQTLAALTFTLNYLNPVVGNAGALDHIWSLCIEEQMYVLLGIVALIHRKRRLPVVPIFAALALFGNVNGALQTAAGGNYHEVYWRTDVRGASLLLGVVAFLAIREGAAERMPWLGPVLFAIGAALNLNAVADPVKYSLGTAALAVSLVVMAQAPATVLAFLAKPALTHIGVWSYSLYLWQQPFYKLPISPALKLAMVPVIFAVALASYYLVERPARDKLNAIFGGGRAGPIERQATLAP